MEKYLSIITNFGCHGKCPYCIVRENGIKVPKTTLGGLDNLTKALKETNRDIISISGGGDPLHEYEKHVDWYRKLFSIVNNYHVNCATYSIPVEMHTSYMTDKSTFPFYDCKRVVYHLNTFEQLKHIHRTVNEIVRVVYVVTKDFTLEQIMNIAMFVADSNEIDELSFRQLVDKGYEVTDYWQDILRFGHKKLWWYIEQCDYNLYYAENKIYTKFSEIGESNET
jgi:hypothetical protein